MAGGYHGGGGGGRGGIFRPTMTLRPFRALVLSSAAICTFPALALAGDSPPQQPPEAVIRKVLVIPSVGVSRREPFHTDAIEAQIVAGTWVVPKEGDAVTLPDGTKRTWRTATAAGDGWIEERELQGGYAYASVESESDHVSILDASGHGLVYVNGEIRAGDPYAAGYVHLPVLLKKGRNDFLFAVGRGRLRAKLVPPPAPVYVETSDPTLPDLVVGVDPRPDPAAVVVVNATTAAVDLRLRAALGAADAHTTAVLRVPALSARKCGFAVTCPAPTAAGEVPLRVEVVRGDPPAAVHAASFPLNVVDPLAVRKRTFVSGIDGSVQYYAIQPARPLSKDAPPPALILSLHGASVEALGQAGAYAAKTWAHVVCPTNRRPFGFDWEDWGRIDAMEVLEDATAHLRPDPSRIYLTGHSMGGHGTWQIGVTFPDRFAAIGPSAGWSSFASYGGGPRGEAKTPMEALFRRAASPSDTPALLSNLESLGVYVLHGDVDDNVPISEARTLVDRLRTFHHDFLFHEQKGANHWWDASPDEPGTDCVDWAPMMDFFARHRRPSDDEVRRVRFTTMSPSVSSDFRWARIEAQTTPFLPSSVDLRWDPGRRRFTGSTENVAWLSLSLAHVSGRDPISVEIDGTPIERIDPPDGRLRIHRGAAGWSYDDPDPDPAGGPRIERPVETRLFKTVFRDRVHLVYGTKGTPEENAWALVKSRYDAETFRVRGNGSVEVLSDEQAVDRVGRGNVVLYGNADTNAAWGRFLAGSPVDIRRGRIRVGERESAGDGLACLLMRPGPSLERLVGVVGGTDVSGMRLTDRLPYFVSGVAYPDLTVFGPEVLEKGFEGVRVAGFFGNDWEVASGEFAWR